VVADDVLVVMSAVDSGASADRICQYMRTSQMPNWNTLRSPCAAARLKLLFVTTMKGKNVHYSLERTVKGNEDIPSR
jgi:hypothetical protein